MKTKSILFTLTFLCSIILFAQKIVVLHSPTNGVQYFNDDIALQTAYTAAIAGDTLYLPGGTHFPPTRFEKQLTIFGAGHYPSATTATYLTKISGNFVISDEADGLYLEGVEITGQLSFDINESVNDVTIKRCRINGSMYILGNGTIPAENNTFIENIIPIVQVDNMLNSMFFNNIIREIYNARNLSFINNTFLRSSPSSGNQVVNYANNCLFKNNVFYQNNNNICEGNGSSTWVNNIFCTSTTTPLLGLDPILVDNYFMTLSDVTTLIYPDIETFDYSFDYHLLPLAAANLGDDGTVTGVYGGFYPWKDFSIPTNPHISSKNISATTDVNGMIQVDINVHAQDN
ncbi:MAG: hypothetical protein L3J25_06480 [Flavobacteriaceae bacterium]|nr:hypothetical protein [Flavobacteriaceae bacterium]